VELLTNHQPPGPNHGDSLTGAGPAITISPFPTWSEPPLVPVQPAPILPDLGIDIASATALTASKDAKELVPSFDPLQAHVEMWLEKIDELATIYNWNDQTRAHFALAKLAGVAAIWYKGLQSVNFSWTEGKFLLMATFLTKRNLYNETKVIIDAQKMPDKTYFKYVHKKLAKFNDLRIMLSDAQKPDLILGEVELAIHIATQGTVLTFWQSLQCA